LAYYYLVKDTNAIMRDIVNAKRLLSLSSASTIAPHNVRLGQSYGTWKVAGTVQNKSQYSLNQFSFAL
jgi:hypothetical protein